MDFIPAMEHAFAVTSIAALVAVGCVAMGGINTTLSRLHAPISYRQLAYIPLGLSLVLWAMLMALYFLLPAVGSEISDAVKLREALSDALSAFPLGLMIVTLINRDARGLMSPYILIFLQLTISFLMIAISGTSFQEEMDYINTLYPKLMPFVLFVALFLIWETPRHRQNWYCATFTRAPSPFGVLATREPLPPQRLGLVSLTANAIATLIPTAIIVVLLFLIARALYAYIPGLSNSISSSSFPTIDVALSMFVTLGLLLSFGLSGLSNLMSGRFGTDRSLTRWVHRYLFYSNLSSADRHAIIEKKLATKCPTTGRYAAIDPWSDAAKSNDQTIHLLNRFAPMAFAPTSIFEVHTVGYVIGLIAFFSFIGLYGIDVDRAREGSNIQGDAQQLPGNHFPAGGGFSQHFVALDLGRIVSPVERAETLAAIQAMVDEDADPASWLPGLTTSGGEAAQVPSRFRIEVSQPKPHVVVIQSLGRHWDPAGHLAYALSKRVLDKLGNPEAIRIDPNFIYIRPMTTFERPRGFLDNRVHWFDGSGTELGSDR